MAGSPNVTALLGKTAYLNCRVKNLGDKTVSSLTFSIIFFIALVVTAEGEATERVSVQVDLAVISLLPRNIAQ